MKALPARGCPSSAGCDSERAARARPCAPGPHSLAAWRAARSGCGRSAAATALPWFELYSSWHMILPQRRCFSIRSKWLQACCKKSSIAIVLVDLSGRRLRRGAAAHASFSSVAKALSYVSSSPAAERSHAQGSTWPARVRQLEVGSARPTRSGRKDAVAEVVVFRLSGPPGWLRADLSRRRLLSTATGPLGERRGGDGH